MALSIENKIAKLFKYQKALEDAQLLYRQPSTNHIKFEIGLQILYIERLIKELQDDTTDNKKR